MGLKAARLGFNKHHVASESFRWTFPSSSTCMSLALWMNIFSWMNLISNALILVIFEHVGFTHFNGWAKREGKRYLCKAPCCLALLCWHEWSLGPAMRFLLSKNFVMKIHGSSGRLSYEQEVVNFCLPKACEVRLNSSKNNCWQPLAKEVITEAQARECQKLLGYQSQNFIWLNTS